MATSRVYAPRLDHAGTPRRQRSTTRRRCPARSARRAACPASARASTGSRRCSRSDLVRRSTWPTMTGSSPRQGTCTAIGRRSRCCRRLHPSAPRASLGYIPAPPRLRLGYTRPQFVGCTLCAHLHSVCRGAPAGRTGCGEMRGIAPASISLCAHRLALLLGGAGAARRRPASARVARCRLLRAAGRRGPRGRPESELSVGSRLDLGCRSHRSSGLTVGPRV